MNSKKEIINKQLNITQRQLVSYIISILIPNNFNIDICPNEAIYTNRAASYIQLKDFKKALDDCKAAL
jgi:hypothetical protein